MGHPTEPGTAKVKLAHYFEDGNKIEFEAHVEADDYASAVSKTEALFTEAVKTLAGGTPPEMRKVKIEM